MYEDRKQNYDPEISEENISYTLPPVTSFISMCRLYSIAINRTNSTERQQFSAVTVSLKSGF